MTRRPAVRRLLGLTTIVACAVAAADAQKLTLPVTDGSVRFAVIGDAGTGGGAQRRVAERIVAARQVFPFEFTLMLGDNLYGGEDAGDYRRKFEEPYKALLDGGVRFYAVLGNHDDPAQRLYKPFNMNGARYYSFKPSLLSNVRFFALDSNYMSQEQLAWLEKELKGSDAEWKIAFFHHPIYSSGEKHGSNLALREQVEPLFVNHGVDVVFTGHEHFYERLKPQRGITYFISGAAAKLRRGNIGDSDLTAKGYDQGYTFMLVEIAGDDMHFQTLDADGKTIDSGTIRRREAGGTASR
jgi:3',5'-cyclic AMP phosphodiesterase CpdA